MRDELEHERLRSLKRLGLDSTSDPVLDQMAQTVQRRLGVPVSLVSLIDADRQYFPGLAGLGGWAAEARETPLTHSFCQHIVARRGPVVIDDTRSDPLADGNLAMDDLEVGAYLGMPITDSAQRVVGSLCAIDTVARTWTVDEIETLQDLADLCSAEIRSREPVGDVGQAPLELLWHAQVSDRHLRSLIDNLPAMITYWDRDLRNVIVNTAALEWFGVRRSEIAGRHAQFLLGAEEFGRSRPHLRSALAGSPGEVDRTITGPHGRTAHVRAHYVPDFAADGTVAGVFVHIADVTALVESAAFHRAVLTASPDLVYVLDIDDRHVVWASRSFSELLGYRPDEVVHLGEEVYTAAVHPDDREALDAANEDARHLGDGEFVELRCRAQHRDGSYRWLSRRITPFARNEEGRVHQVLALSRDIQDTVELTERLENAAVSDHLTGLPNRRLLADRLSVALKRQSRSGLAVPVLFCDLDGFKRVNDTAGHQAGDAVLLTVARRLTNALRPGDTVARVGGDEFVIVLDPTMTPREPDAEPERTRIVQQRSAMVVAERICDVVKEVIRVDGLDHYVTASVGITLAAADEDAAEVIRNADAAMYQAKSRGKARAEFYDRSLRSRTDSYRLIDTALRSSLSIGDPVADPAARPGPLVPHQRRRTPPFAGLSVAYQPIYDLQTMTIVGFEALARLRDANGASIPPHEFIPIAEETGIMARLGDFILNTACRDLAGWRRLPHCADLGVSVNLSARQAGFVDLVADVSAALDRTDLPPAALTLELTESVLLETGRSTITAVRALRDRGVLVAIDDFGTGYASLRCLAELPVTSVKVDRSFTSGLPNDRVSLSIVKAIIGIAQEIGISCVVEGIETAEELGSLPAGVLGQGYLLGRPMSDVEVDALLTGPARRGADADTPAVVGALSRDRSPIGSDGAGRLRPHDTIGA